MRQFLPLLGLCLLVGTVRASETEVLADLYQQNSPPVQTALLVLAGMSIVALGLVLERTWALATSRIAPASFVEQLRKHLADGEDNGAMLRLCDQSAAALARVLRAGVLRCGRPLGEIDKAMEDALANETQALRGRVRAVATIGTMAPIVGALGTLAGMMMSFRAASQAGGGKAELFAEGLWLALGATAGGLLLALVATGCAAWLHAQIDQRARTIERTLQDTIPWFAGNDHYQGAVGEIGAVAAVIEG